MFNHDTDRDWETYGKHDPYFGVWILDKFRKSKLTDETKEEFFKSGHEFIEMMTKKIRKIIDSDYSVRKALEFGCGVGRLMIPLSEIAETVTGVDVSESMLKEAKKNCEMRNIKNIDLVKSDDNLAGVSGKFNLIYSYNVFQHIPVKRGEHIFENLIAILEDGGVCVIHFTYAKSYKIGKLSLFKEYVKSYLPFAKNIIDMIEGRPNYNPEMKMNNYGLNKIIFFIQKTKVSQLHIVFTDHGGNLGIIVCFQKPKKV